jgi:hypothetical protein
MRRVLLIAFAAGLLAGCEPAPSTPLAEDKKMPDTSKMSKEEIDKLLQGNRDRDAKAR